MITADDKLLQAAVSVLAQIAIARLATNRVLRHLTEPVLPSLSERLMKSTDVPATPQPHSAAQRRALVGQKPISRPVSRPAKDRVLALPCEGSEDDAANRLRDIPKTGTVATNGHRLEPLRDPSQGFQRTLKPPDGFRTAEKPRFPTSRKTTRVLIQPYPSTV